MKTHMRAFHPFSARIFSHCLLLLMTSHRGCSEKPPPVQIDGLGLGEFPVGFGLDLAVTDLHTFDTIYPIRLSANATFGQQCAIDSSICPNTFQDSSSFFSDSNTWQSEQSHSLGFSGSFVDGGLTTTIDSSLTMESENFGTSDVTILQVKQLHRDACKVLDNSCLTWSFLQPQLLSTLEALLGTQTSVSLDAAVLQEWADVYVRKYGSHVILTADYGALLRNKISFIRDCQASQACAAFSLCGSGKKKTEAWAANLSVCADAATCSQGATCKTQATTSCLALGGVRGDPSVDPCTTTDAQALATWFSTEVVPSSFSLIGVTLASMVDFLRELQKKGPGPIKNLELMLSQLEAAVAYRMCTASVNQGRFTWVVDPSLPLGYACVCSLQCARPHAQNLQNSTEGWPCVCGCRGDENHGFAGPTCELSYGTCQPGPGTGNPGSACNGNNECFSAFSRVLPEPNNTQVCCNTDFSSVACPFGDSCSCGAFSCSCSSHTIIEKANAHLAAVGTLFHHVLTRVNFALFMIFAVSVSGIVLHCRR